MEKETTWGQIVLIIAICYCAIGVFLGGMSTFIARMEYKDGCIYRSVVAYINPGYLGMCELARARFNVEQPVEYVPENTKKLGE